MKGDAHKSLLWSGVQQFVVFGIQFGVGILLARLLNPYDFGVIAMQGVFFAISNAFIDCGSEGALIQKKKCTKAISIVLALLLITGVLCVFPVSIALFLFYQRLVVRKYGSPMECCFNQGNDSS